MNITPNVIEVAKKAMLDGLHREGDADIQAGLAWLSDEAATRIVSEMLAAAMQEATKP
jgi:hypothetical protein